MKSLLLGSRRRPKRQRACQGNSRLVLRCGFIGRCVVLLMPQSVPENTRVQPLIGVSQRPTCCPSPRGCSRQGPDSPQRWNQRHVDAHRNENSRSAARPRARPPTAVVTTFSCLARAASRADDTVDRGRNAQPGVSYPHVAHRHSVALQVQQRIVPLQSAEDLAKTEGAGPRHVCLGNDSCLAKCANGRIGQIPWFGSVAAVYRAEKLTHAGKNSWLD